MSAPKQTPEAIAFLDCVAQLPSGHVILDDVLRPSLDDEKELRKLFATDKDNVRLRDPFVGLVDVFAAPATIRTTRQRIVNNDEELTSKHIMPLPKSKRRKEGEPAMVQDYDEFLNNFKIFSEGSLSQLDWSNVIVAGGSILASLLPVPQQYKKSKRSLRKWFHSTAYPVSDVDLFLWGLDEEQAERKLQSIYEAVRDSIPWDVTCIRTKHAISIHSQYPYRSVQIVLRLYSSPAEVLAGFDIDAPCCAFDGERVWANPRAIIAMMRQANSVDVTRRSPSYEVRLAKYSMRSFEVYVPNLRREDVDPTIYERSIVRIEGLARLLVLEKLSNPDSRTSYLDSRRQLRGRPNLDRPWQKRGREYKGDLKADTTLDGLQMNDYDVTSLHIPYGPSWDARRIDKLVYQTDLGMNSPFNPKNKDRVLHRHPAFFGTMDECVEDCCGACSRPEGGEEEELQRKEDDKYIHGRVRFIKQDPGRQSLSGSFNPIDDGEWTAMAYIGATEKFFSAIAVGDRVTVRRMLDEGTDPNRRDHVGRAPIHVAIMCQQKDMVTDLINFNARMTARLVDGRTSLHLAAQLGEVEIMRKLLERSALNAKEAEKDYKGSSNDDDAMDTDSDGESSNPISDPETDVDRPSSEDDWSSDSSDGKPANISKKDAGPPEGDTGNGLPEDSEDEPDVFDVNLPDWDLAFTPLGHAVVAGSLDAVGLLLAHGADPSIHTKAKEYGAQDLHPLGLTVITENKDDASRIAARLVMAGATSSKADNELLSIFHRILRAPGTVDIVATLLNCDPTAKVALRYPVFERGTALFPLVSAIDIGDWSKLAVLVSHGAKASITEEDVARAKEVRSEKGQRSSYYYRQESYPGNTIMPLEVALANGDDVAHLLVSLGADVHQPVHFAATQDWNPERYLTLVDWLRMAVSVLEEDTPVQEGQNSSGGDVMLPGELVSESKTWKEYVHRLREQIRFADKVKQTPDDSKEEQSEREKKLQVKTYIDETLALLRSSKAKTWNELYPDKKTDSNQGQELRTRRDSEDKPVPGYTRTREWRGEVIPSYQWPLYDQLFEACWLGDDETIRRLCLPSENASESLLEITVQWRADTTSGGYNGYSTMHAALLQRHWDTAELIIAIAAKQYVVEEKKLPKYSTSDMDIDDDKSDEEDYNSDKHDGSDSDMTVDVKFTELGGVPLTVRSRVSPRSLLEDSFEWVNRDGDHTIVTMLKKSITEHDLEAFTNILDLYKKSDPLISLPPFILHDIIRNDDPAILDEYIRRTGAGVPLTEDHNNKKASSEDTPASHKPRSRKRVYHGLDVHGKKRKDLASRGDPDARVTTKPNPEKPILWVAAEESSAKIVEYLSGSRPTVSYAAYAAKNNDRRARAIRQVSDLSSVLPAWLGWKINVVNESPLVASVRSGNAEIIDQLFALQPQLMSEALNTPIKFVGTTPLMIAVGYNVEVVESLIKRGADVTASDKNGRNIYHVAVEQGNHETLSFLLRSLPWDVSRHLLVQQMKPEEYARTPLHIAVHRRKHYIVQILLEVAQEPVALDKRDISGEMPLHTAVLAGFAEITRLLLKSAAIAGIGIYAENATGDTVLDIAVQRYLLQKTREVSQMGGACEPRELEFHTVNIKDPIQSDTEKLERTLTSFKATLNVLLGQGTALDDPQTLHAFRAFTTRMEGKLESARARDRERESKKKADDKSKEPDLSYDSSDPQSTLEHVRAAVAARPGHRSLVHLADVQTSVKGHLAEQARREARDAASARKSKVDEEGEEEEANQGDYFVRQSVFCLLDHKTVEDAFAHIEIVEAN